MLFNAYLIYLATVISTYSFNTYNYIKKRIDVNNEKRKMVYRKNLSVGTKKYIKDAELLPVISYLTSSLYSLLPIYNLVVPEKMEKWYYRTNLYQSSIDLINKANNEEIIHRYMNGAAIELMREVGYTVPDFKLKEPKQAAMSLPLYLALKQKVNDYFLSIDVEPRDIFELEPFSNKEYAKAQKKINKLTKNENLDHEKIKILNNKY